MKYRATGAVALAASSLILAACGTTSSSPSASSPPASSETSSSSSASSAKSPTSDHNSADVSFATGMVPHHQQAVTMADMALKAGKSSDVTSIAREIKKAQDPEITKMSGWLKAWGEPVPAASSSSMDGMAGMDHGTGMMSADEMSSLGKATGTRFDRMWVDLMIKHHQGAVTMSKTEVSDGKDAEAKKLARAIITSQSTEIDQMKAILAKLPG